MMNFVAASVLGFLLGGVIIYFIQEKKVTRLFERLSAKEAELLSERATKEKVLNEFKFAASEALRAVNEQFLSTAIKDLRQVRTEADKDIEQNKQEISFSVSDMKAKLDDTQKIVRKFEDERAAMYGKLDQALAQVLSAEQAIRLETGALKRVLTSSSGIRGKWGEKILQEILEQNDFVKGIHFDTQVFVLGESEGGDSFRPDFVLHLPGNKKLIVDSKEVAGEYVLAQETQDPAEQKEHYDRLVQNIRNNFIKLSRKEYQSQLDPNIPFVIMFIPSEAAIRAAFATDPGIFQEATEKRVILASPMTIIPLIYLIKHGWQQEQLAANARDLGAAVELLGERLYSFLDHLQNVRSGINKASESWNKAVGSWEARVSPQVEKVKALGGKLKESPELVSIENVPRILDQVISEKKSS